MPVPTPPIFVLPWTEFCARTRLACSSCLRWAAAPRRKRPWRTQIARRPTKITWACTSSATTAAAARGGTAPGTLGVGRRAAGPGPGADPEEVPDLIERGRSEPSKPLRLPKPCRSVSLALPWPYRCLLFGLRFLGGLGPARPDAESLAQQRLARGVASEVWRFSPTPSCTPTPRNLLVNMFALYSLGGFLEALLGGRRYLAVYCASAVGGGIATAVAGGLRVAMGGLPSYSVGAFRRHLGSDGRHPGAGARPTAGATPTHRTRVAPAPAAGAGSSTWRCRSCPDRSVRALWGRLGRLPADSQ